MNILCECPACDVEINLRGCKEHDVIVCSECETELEIVSLRPPVLGEAPDDDKEWEDDDGEWENGDEEWNEEADGEDEGESWRTRSRLEWDADEDDVL